MKRTSFEEYMRPDKGIQEKTVDARYAKLIAITENDNSIEQVGECCLNCKYKIFNATDRKEVTYMEPPFMTVPILTIEPVNGMFGRCSVIRPESTTKSIHSIWPESPEYDCEHWYHEGEPFFLDLPHPERNKNRFKGVRP